MYSHKKLAALVAVFLIAYFLPLEAERLRTGILEGFFLLRDYAREHVLFCLVPAFFIAGAIAVFVTRDAVVRYFGPQAPKLLSYGIASVSGTVLAVCSCTVLPLFAGIYKRGAGIGPATAFLYSGPAINVLAIILTARVLGWQLGAARAVGAIAFAVVIGLVMALFFPDEEGERGMSGALGGEDGVTPGQRGLFILSLVLVLIFAAWGKPAEPVGFWNAVYAVKWPLTAAALAWMAFMLWRWFGGGERREWLEQTWFFAAQILPLLFGGVPVAGLLLGRTGMDQGLIPAHYVAAAVGGNGFAANALASVAGAFMYFATLTEIPILEGLLGSGMGQGPALALLLAGPALSLPNMLVIRSVMGTKRTLVFCGLVVVMATITGMIYGALVA